MILDELGRLPFSAASGALLFYLIGKLHEHVSLVNTTNLSFAGWASEFGDPKMTTALLDRLTHHYRIVEAGNGSYRFKTQSSDTKQEDKAPAPPPEGTCTPSGWLDFL